MDPKGILRAAFSNAQGNSTQGASTITQQYVKILYLTQERTWKRKAKEAILSLKIKNQAEQAADPRGLPQHDLLRPGRLRHPGRLAGLLRRRRQEARPRPVRRPRLCAQQPGRARPGQRCRRRGAAARALPVRPGLHGDHEDRQCRRRGEHPQGAAEVPQDQERHDLRRPARPRADDGPQAVCSPSASASRRSRVAACRSPPPSPRRP
ncbi:transglycosylase domain-containing protein [Nocardioides sp. W3-2-3]|nr:transglycosylase domain-containing protein [Nocardioides convexus]